MNLNKFLSPAFAARPRKVVTLNLLMAAMLLLTTCTAGRGSTANELEAAASAITVDTLPEGLGRGFPIATVDDVDNRNTGVDTGELAPDFRLIFTDGRSLTLRDLQGRPVMLNFWATWCGPCRLEMPEIVQQSEAHGDLVVLAINVQEELEPIQAFTEDFHMSMPVVRDEAGGLRKLYQIRGMPTSVFINREGKIVKTWAGLLTPGLLAELLDDIL
jgi:thiol-disulfide isomerase/thioredoxin